MPIEDQPSLTGHYSQYLESQIADPAVKATLMGRSHEAMRGAIAQGNLATARLDAYMAEKRTAVPASNTPKPSGNP